VDCHQNDDANADSTNEHLETPFLRLLFVHSVGRHQVYRRRSQQIARNVAERVAGHNNAEMGRKEKIACDCGGELPRPLPTECPHCGAPIVTRRRRWWPVMIGLLIVGSMFAALVLYLRWLLGEA